MRSCRIARAIGFLVGIMLVTQSEAWANETPEMAARSESVRVDVGLGIAGNLGGGGAVAGLGGGPLISTGVAVEAHLAGPAWLVVRGSGGFTQWDTEGVASASSSFAGLRVGPRFEWRVIDYFDAGFHVQANGAVAHDEGSASSGADAYDGDAYEVGGVAGGSIHYRATSVFGVRLAVDLVKAGYASSWNDTGKASVSAGYANLSPAPSAELTFTF